MHEKPVNNKAQLACVQIKTTAYPDNHLPFSLHMQIKTKKRSARLFISP